ncbi:M24 family metallopeptidase [Dokdonia donghaensis]|uniref:Xaa-Pro aminopeptidase n=1 Tax=Dokdonia donghaensis DSW-1 TaxID=1300343 RepID=A0A0A2H0D8_9FLAO|nr:M24 family metallopeptidase [Dokdonia donghaensis]ANH61531.1 Metallopeptidase family M24 [Dokdonia donghaensis DSW-1]KGO06135.1 Xaa-Pro aminopeptidase [Dokdonia donghaensis DSW-1]
MRRLIVLALLFITTISTSQVLSERDRATVIDEVLADRFNNLLPKLMDRADIDMWVVISREYNEDPVLKTMLPSTWLNARRRTILVFYRDKEANTIEKLAVARYNVGKNIISAWDKEKQPDQWQRLLEIIEKRNPSKIGLNYSDNYGLADGVVKTDYDAFISRLTRAQQVKVVSAEQLAVGWLETRTALEVGYFEQLVDITHDIIKDAFSAKVITPGVTSTDDVVWYLRQRVTDMGLETWFHPTVDIQRSEEKLESHIVSFSNRPEGKIIQKGDLIHCDFGITYLRLNTDCQQHAYVPKDGETKAPDFLIKAFKDGNKIQDILTSNFETGRSGNEILLAALKEGKEAGLRPSIYTHPLGMYGHAAGPTIGMWDSQGGVPGTGDYPLYENTGYAIELNTTVKIPEWNKDIRIMLEEAGFWGEDGFRYVSGRQEELMLVD